MAIKKEVKTGIVVVVALSMLVYGINFLKGINLFSQTHKYYVKYKDVQGLVPANPVLVNGFHIGQVQDIKILPNTANELVLTLLITNPDVKVPKSSVAKITTDGLLGTKAVEISLGTGDIAKDGDTIAGAVSQGIMDQVSEQVAPLRQKAEQLITSIDSTLVIVQDVFTMKTRGSLSQSIESINVSLKHLESTTGNLDDLMASQKKRIADIFDKVDEITDSIAKNSKQLSSAIKNMASITDQIAKSNLQGTIANADSALYYTSKLMQKINKGQGSLGMLANDTSLYKRLSASAASLNALLEDMKAHPKRYVHFSVF